MDVRFALLCAFAACSVAAPAYADRVKAAVFGFQLVDTSAIGTSGLGTAERARLRLLDARLDQKLRDAGYQLVSTAPLAVQIRQQDMLDCAVCAPDFAHQLGADLAIVGRVQKVSNLILNVNLVVRDARTGKLERAGSVSIRSNTDESWKRGLDYLLTEKILPPGEAIPQ